jgi:hypothetical protein
MLIDVHTSATETGTQEIHYVLEGYGRKLHMQSDNSWVRPAECNIPAAPGHYVVKLNGIVRIMELKWDGRHGVWYDVETLDEIELPIF